MDSDTNAEISTVPTTPSRYSNRHELLWENLPDCTDEHWEEIGRTPNPKIETRPRNYSKTVNMSDRRRSLSEGQDWFDELNQTDFDEVFVRDAMVPTRNASTKVSSKFRGSRSLRSDGSEDSSSRRTFLNRERKTSSGPRLLDSADFSSSSDDVIHGPLFYMETGTGKKSLISQSTSMHSSAGNSSDVLSTKNNRRQLIKDISRAAKQLKYSEPSRHRRQKGQRAASLSATVNGSQTQQQHVAYSAIDWPLYEGSATRKNRSKIHDGNKPTGKTFRNSKQNPSVKMEQCSGSVNLQEIPTSSDEGCQSGNDCFASSRDSYEASTSKNSCSQDTSPLKPRFAWNICFDPTPMRSDDDRSTPGEREESSTNSTKHGFNVAAAAAPGSSRKKWDKISKTPNLGKCREDFLTSNAFDDGQPDLLDLSNGNFGNEAENEPHKYSQTSLLSVHDQYIYNGTRNWSEAMKPLSRTQKPCDLKEMTKAKSCSERRPKEYPVMVSKHSDSHRREFTNSRSGNCYSEKTTNQRLRRNDKTEKRRSRKQECKCKLHGRERSDGEYEQPRTHCEIYNDSSESVESSWNESCRHGCVSQGCPIAAYLPLLLSHCCKPRTSLECNCKRRINRCCSESKPRCCSRRRKPCNVHGKQRGTRVGPVVDRYNFDAYDEVDRDVHGEKDCIDGKTYTVSGKSENNRMRRSNSLIFAKSTVPPVLISYSRNVDTATELLEAEQKSDVSSQTEPTTANCATQAKPTVRHSVTQYSAKVNHCNKDTQCITHTASVCTQAVVFEPLDRATQFPERRENHHKQTQCNLATARKSVQANFKYKPNHCGYNYGFGSNYHRRDDYFSEDSFRSSHSSYMMAPDASTNLTVIAPKSAPPSAVVALAAATASADFKPKMDTSRDSSDQKETQEISPVTLRCSVMSVRPSERFSNENLLGVTGRSEEDCVDGRRQRTMSLRSSSLEITEGSHYSRNRGKSVSFPPEIARFFDHPANSQRRGTSDDSDSSDSIEVRTSKYRDYLN